MVVYYTPCVDFGAESVYWLPPPLTSWDETDNTRVQIFPRLAGEGRILGSRFNDGPSISISGWIIAESWQGIMDEQALMREAFDGRGSDKMFRLWRYHNRYREDCVCVDSPQFGLPHPANGLPRLVCTWSANIECLDPVVYDDVEAPYGEYPYNDRVYYGGDGGEGTTLPITSRYNLHFAFPGLAEETTSGREIIFEIEADATETRAIEKLVISGAVSLPGVAGTTTVRARRDAGVGGTSNSVAVDLTYAEPDSGTTKQTVCDIAVEDGEKIFVFLEDNAGANGGQDHISGYLIIGS